MEKYFITCDLESTTGLSKGITPLLTEQMSSIRDNTKYLVNSVFKDIKCEVISYADICYFFQSNVKQDEFILSLDNGIYISDADAYFDSTRVYNSINDINSPENYTIKTRDGYDLGTQVDKIISKIKLSKKTKVVICDDGIFTGNTLSDVINIIKKNGIEVSEIRVILNFKKSDNIGGVKITSMYQDETCKDWIDERDFYYGLKMSGASFYNNGKINGLPYISIPKIASKKSSIPEEFSNEFCDIMITQNIDLWKKISDVNSKVIQLLDLPRLEYLQNYYNKYINIVDLLHEEKQKFNFNFINHDTKNNYGYRSLSGGCFSNNVCY